MQSAMFHKEKSVLREIANASDAIRKKHKSLKLGKISSEKIMSDVFKPVVSPLEKLVDQSMMKQESTVKQEPPEIKREKHDYDDQFDRPFNRTLDHTFATAHGNSSDEEEEEEELNTTVHDNDGAGLAERYLDMFNTKEQKDLDLSSGVRNLQGNRLAIGDSPITFDNNTIHIRDRNYQQSEGLLELLFKKSPNETLVSAHDIENYREILNLTNAHRKYYNRNNAIREDKTAKFQNIIVSIMNSPAKRLQMKTPKKSSHPSGKGLPRYMIAQKQHKIDYVYWDDPNELVSRLRLLLASQAAGNLSHSNEIMSIIEELREAEIIY